MKIKESRIVSPSKVRASCIEANWYTRGTNEEYGRMLDSVDDLKNLNGAEFMLSLYDIACDIYYHSDVDLGIYGFAKDEYIAHIMFIITNDCTTFAYDIEN